MKGKRWCANSADDKVTHSDALRQHDQRHEHSACHRFSAQASFFQLWVLLQSPTSSIVEFVCLGPTSSLPTLLSLFPTAVQLATSKPRVQIAKLLRSAAALPSLRMPPVGHQRHCHAVWTIVTFSSTSSAEHLGQSPSWRSPDAFSCNTPCSRPVQSNCALALIPVRCWTRTLTSSRI